jgi:UV DNA damage endonuclease
VQAKDKEQAVFQLYRIYNLKPVIHENLRPEKATKPKAATVGDDDGETQVDNESKSPTKRKTRTPKKEPAKSRKAKDAKGQEELPDVPKAEEKSVEGPTTTPKRRARKPKDDVSLATAAPAAKKRRTNSKATASSLEKTDLECLINQEDDPVPVDGAPLEVVEAEEHPEAAVAIIEGQDLGCATKKRKSTRRSKAVIV